MASFMSQLIVFSIFAVLAITSFLIIQPFIGAIFTALLLAFIFRPLYLKINSKINQPTAVALLTSLLVIFILSIIVFVTLQITVKQVLDFYTYTQQSDILAPIRALVIKFTSIDPTQFSLLFDTVIENVTSLTVNSINSLLLNLPFLILQAVVTLFVMFYFIRDGREIVNYMKSILPFRDKTKDKIISRFKEITSAVIYGSIIVGIIQGIVAGIGFFLFGVEGAFVLTLFAIVLSILPLGSWIIWLPTSINFLLSGETFAGIGLLIYGIIVISYIDNILRPNFVSKKSQLSPVTAVLGMLGGALLFGIIGIFVGPIILDYFITFVEFYKKRAHEVM
ncbi:AI-2E family transporter [Nanoarchaeota archaeon]